MEWAQGAGDGDEGSDEDGKVKSSISATMGGPQATHGCICPLTLILPIPQGSLGTVVLVLGGCKVQTRAVGKGSGCVLLAVNLKPLVFNEQKVYFPKLLQCSSCFHHSPWALVLFGTHGWFLHPQACVGAAVTLWELLCLPSVQTGSPSATTKNELPFLSDPAGDLQLTQPLEALISP